MGRQRITDEEVEKHLDALEAIGPGLADARAESDFRQEILKTVYAAAYMRSDGTRAADREAEAYASDEYRDALDDRRVAMAKAEKLRHEKAWRERCIDVWQTLSANNRGRI